MKTRVLRTQRKRFVSLLLVFSAMVSLLVPFDITAFADAPATGGDIRAVKYINGTTQELVFLNAFSELPTDKGNLIWDSFDQNLDGNQDDRIDISNLVPLNEALNSNGSPKVSSTSTLLDPSLNKRIKIPWGPERELADGKEKITTNITTVTFLDEIQPTSTAFWFSDLRNVTEFKNLSKLDTSKVTCMAEMFRYCQKVKSLDVGHFDTSKCESLWDMFTGCSQLTSLDVSRWDVSKVGGAAGLFFGCQNVTELDVSNWRTPKMFNMQGMFRQCRKLTKLDLHNFDFKNVVTIQSHPTKI